MALTLPTARVIDSESIENADAPLKKRRKIARDPASTLTELSANTQVTSINGFLVDSSDDGDSDDEKHLRQSPPAPSDHSKASRSDQVSRDAQASRSEVQLDNDGELTTDADISFDQEQKSSDSKTPDSQRAFGQSSYTLQQPPTGESMVTIRTCSGAVEHVSSRQGLPTLALQNGASAYDTHTQESSTRTSYGIPIHELLEEIRSESKVISEKVEDDTRVPEPSVEQLPKGNGKLWTEKYRPQKFTDLIGDERTHRAVLHWLKGWDSIVFPGAKSVPKKLEKDSGQSSERHIPKILLLGGSPGMGKTTLAHVCARQAGYEVQEINASDERSRDVVNGRIRDMVGTENVRAVTSRQQGAVKSNSARPLCVVVDEVDGVVTGSGGTGEGGFIKALVDLTALDLKNSKAAISGETNGPKRKGRGDKFRFRRPLILICNDVYHPSLRLLRQSSAAEIIHVRKPDLDMVIPRMQEIFIREGIQNDSDGIRRMCETAWGLASRKERGSTIGASDGDIRGILVAGEWIARKFRAQSNKKEQGHPLKITRAWMEQYAIQELSSEGNGARGLHRGGTRDVVERIFLLGAGLVKETRNKTPGLSKRTETAHSRDLLLHRADRTTQRLREMIDTCGEHDKVLTECFTTYPQVSYQDDNFLSKPKRAYEWLDFHDRLTSAVHGAQHWELGSYLTFAPMAFHHLFATQQKVRTDSNSKKGDEKEETDARQSKFSGPSAAYAAAEDHKVHKAAINAFQTELGLPLARSYRSNHAILTELLPYVVRMLNPPISPVVVAGSGSDSSTATVRRAGEKALVDRAVNAMHAIGVRFERSKVEHVDNNSFGSRNFGGYVYRMEPALDSIVTFSEGKTSSEVAKGVRYAVRQVLDLECKRRSVADEALKRRHDQEPAAKIKDRADKTVDGEAGVSDGGIKVAPVKRDFFGRVVETPSSDSEGNGGSNHNKRDMSAQNSTDAYRVWVTYNEGFSNAVRKPITLAELMMGF